MKWTCLCDDKSTNFKVKSQIRKLSLSNDLKRFCGFFLKRKRALKLFLVFLQGNRPWFVVAFEAPTMIGRVQVASVTYTKTRIPVYQLDFDKNSFISELTIPSQKSVLGTGAWISVVDEPCVTIAQEQVSLWCGESPLAMVSQPKQKTQTSWFSCR